MLSSPLFFHLHRLYRVSCASDANTLSIPYITSYHTGHSPILTEHAADSTEPYLDACHSEEL